MSIGWQKPFRGTQLNKAHPLSKGLVGAWIMNESTGETVYDLSNHANNGALVGDASWAAGADGSCVRLDGDSDWIDCGGSNSLNDMTAWSVISRCKHDDIGASPSYARMWSKGVYTIRLELRGPYSGGYCGVFGQRQYDGTDAKATSTDLIFPMGEWADLAFLYDENGSRYMNIFLNGDEISYAFQSASTGTLRSDSSDNARIGSAGASYNYDWTGDFGFVYVYNRKLSKIEIALLHREPYCMFTRALDIGAMLYAVPVVGGSIINQFQKANLGADLFNGSLI